MKPGRFMNYDEYKTATPPDYPEWDEYWEKVSTFKDCPVCGEYQHESRYVNTTDGEMCRDCYEYLNRECPDDNPPKLISND